MRVLTAAASAALALALGGCALDPSATEGQGAASLTAADGSDAAPCPTEQPGAGTACATRGLVCSYGDDARFGCRPLAACPTSGPRVWNLHVNACPSPPPSCPATAPPSTGSGGSPATCTVAQLGLSCVYGETVLTCANCNGSLCTPGYHWYADTVAAACPTRLPNYGARCAHEGLVCDYNSCINDEQRGYEFVQGEPTTCVDGHWVVYQSGDACL